MHPDMPRVGDKVKLKDALPLNHAAKPFITVGNVYEVKDRTGNRLVVDSDQPNMTVQIYWEYFMKII